MRKMEEVNLLIEVIDQQVNRVTKEIGDLTKKKVVKVGDFYVKIFKKREEDPFFVRVMDGEDEHNSNSVGYHVGTQPTGLLVELLKGNTVMRKNNNTRDVKKVLKAKRDLFDSIDFSDMDEDKWEAPLIELERGKKMKIVFL